MLCGFASAENSTTDEKMTALTLSGITGFTELHDISISAREDFRATRLGIYDVSSCGAATATLTAQLSLTNTSESVLGVVCTDGFVESFNVAGDRFVDKGEIKSHSGNIDNNLLVYMGVKQSTITDMPFEGSETELFRTNSASADIGAVAASQGTASEGTYTVKFANSASGAPLNTVSLLISSQPDVFLGKEGRITRSIIK